MVALASALSIFLASSAIIEKHHFAVVYGGGSLRLIAVLGLVLFIAFYMRRAFETKEVEFLLARPISKLAFLSSHVLAFIILSLCIVTAVVIFLGLTGRPHFGGLMMWGVSLFLEMAVMASATLFFAMVIHSPAGSALAALGLYTLGRMMGILMGISQYPAEKFYMVLANKVMEVISIVIPRFDLNAHTVWLIYGVDDHQTLGFTYAASERVKETMLAMGHGGFVVIQSLIMIAVFLTAALYDLKRKQF
jgi:hypothetical protein